MTRIVTDADLIARAAAICVARRGGVDLPDRIFTTDGCSVWPDSDWGHCCVEHDISYIQNWTLGLDIRILLLTRWRGWFSRNAY